jgi:c-di-GMP-related signal transduction protein
MKQYIARQPIFNVHKKLFAYELLYRGITPHSPDEIGGSQATASLLSSTFLTKDIEEISSHKACFINFTQELLEHSLPAMFPKLNIVVEALEDVQPTRKVIENCRQLRDNGYRIALDDFIYDRDLRH